MLSTRAADTSTDQLADLGQQPSPIESANPFTDAAILVAFGAVLLMLAVRTRDAANVDPDTTPGHGA